MVRASSPSSNSSKKVLQTPPFLLVFTHEQDLPAQVAAVPDRTDHRAAVAQILQHCAATGHGEEQGRV